MKPRWRRSTPAGEHRPVLLQEILTLLAPEPGQTMVDGTVGFGGHAAALADRLGPTGLLIGFDLDSEHLAKARTRLDARGCPTHLVQGNFAGLSNVLGLLQCPGVHGLVADLGMSSMQVDDPERGFSYRRDGALDMRMDRGRGRGAAHWLATISREDLTLALRELGDEPEAGAIAEAIVERRRLKPLTRTSELVDLILEATGQTGWRLHPAAGRWNLHPAARTFQALRMLVNRELANLEYLLRILPEALLPGGKAAIITFHSGEDRLVKKAFQEGKWRGLYETIANEPLRAGREERYDNPRSRSAKLRWAVKAIG